MQVNWKRAGLWRSSKNPTSLIKDKLKACQWDMKRPIKSERLFLWHISYPCQKLTKRNLKFYKKKRNISVPLLKEGGVVIADNLKKAKCFNPLLGSVFPASTLCTNENLCFGFLGGIPTALVVIDQQGIESLLERLDSSSSTGSHDLSPLCSCMQALPNTCASLEESIMKKDCRLANLPVHKSGFDVSLIIIGQSF